MRATLLAVLIIPSVALADAYVCQSTNGTRTFSSTPCATHEKIIRSTQSPTTGQPSQQADYSAQLRRIQQNRADLDRQFAANTGSTSIPPPMSDAEKRNTCQGIRNRIDYIDSYLNGDWRQRSMSSAENRQQLRDEKQELQQRRLALGC